MNRGDETPLFRKEAMDEQQDRWLGTVLLVPAVSHRIITAVIALVTAGLVGLIVFGEYTREVRLQGWLTPEQGLLQVVSPQSGVLSQVLAEEGMEVPQGGTLAVLSTERRSEVMGDTQQEVVRALRARHESLVRERDSHLDLFAQQAESQAARLELVSAEASDLEGEIDIQSQRTEMAEAAFVRLRELRDRGLTTEDDLRRAEETAFEQALALQSMQRSRAAMARTRLDLETEISERPLRQELQLAEIDRALSAIAQEIAEAEAAREAVISAPQSGMVTAMRATTGDSVAAGAPLMTLIPSGAVLEARLYGPSRDIGFLRPGQQVMIRYDAFPHQRFGQYGGTVRTVSRATVGPGELAEAATGQLSELATAGEPVYRVTVELGSQTATAYGNAASLHPGMTLTADVQIETLRLWQWILAPLNSLRGSAA
ncbi:HlyD family efflux transporter periplasmic adaptor subunit [Sulfitobacter sp. D35]|uniref:HlyD family secretion protein n=1 Tax=Sulfitobacter sp. D35 TaxID=3083252 RepID=UPI00296E9D2C|nr:HlyD family efflux transporter periplasmic adaptor subunit [Sulfitobacter sp. D35]MDW4499226.1 HlyD family efflux transporter periplasmic adaptor subunit [Sulfitobacter sp. D35]